MQPADSIKTRFLWSECVNPVELKYKLSLLKRSNIIEISESLNIPDGSEVLIEVPDAPRTSNDERLKHLHQIFGAWKYETELGEIFAEIDKERHSYFGRLIDFLNY